MKDDRLDDLDTSGPYSDWSKHIRTVERQTVPPPAELTETIERLENQLTTLAEQAPVAALERLTDYAGREAAHAAEADELSWETIGKALGLSPDTARSRLTSYRIHE